MGSIGSDGDWRFANDAGHEIFRLLVARAEELGDRPFPDVLRAMMAATAVCLANVLRPAVEVASDPAAIADDLIAVCGNQARAFLDSVVAARTDPE